MLSEKVIKTHSTDQSESESWVTLDKTIGFAPSMTVDELPARAFHARSVIHQAVYVRVALVQESHQV